MLPNFSKINLTPNLILTIISNPDHKLNLFLWFGVYHLGAFKKINFVQKHFLVILITVNPHQKYYMEEFVCNHIKIILLGASF